MKSYRAAEYKRLCPICGRPLQWTVQGLDRGRVLYSGESRLQALDSLSSAGCGMVRILGSYRCLNSDYSKVVYDEYVDARY